MGPVNLVVGHHQELGLRPLLHWLVWERSWVWSRISVCASRKVATYGDRPQEAYARHTWTGVGSVRVVLVGFPLQGVHRFESP
jgi:hypothetical protein